MRAAWRQHLPSLRRHGEYNTLKRVLVTPHFGNHADFAESSQQPPRFRVFYARPHAARSSSALSVRSQVNSGSSRPKCP